MHQDQKLQAKAAETAQRGLEQEFKRLQFEA